MITLDTLGNERQITEDFLSRSRHAFREEYPQISKQTYWKAGQELLDRVISATHPGYIEGDFKTAMKEHDNNPFFTPSDLFEAYDLLSATGFLSRRRKAVTSIEELSRFVKKQGRGGHILTDDERDVKRFADLVFPYVDVLNAVSPDWVLSTHDPTSQGFENTTVTITSSCRKGQIEIDAPEFEDTLNSSRISLDRNGHLHALEGTLPKNVYEIYARPARMMLFNPKVSSDFREQTAEAVMKYTERSGILEINNAKYHDDKEEELTR